MTEVVLCRNCGTLLDEEDRAHPYCNRRCWSEFAQENSDWYEAIDDLRDGKRGDDDPH